MHRNLLAKGRQRLGGSSTLERDEHADLAEARRDLVVDVGHDGALTHVHDRCAAERLVLADLGDIIGQRLGDRSAARILGGAKRLNVRAMRASTTASTAAGRYTSPPRIRS